ncbi:MAG: TipJ family phage tail tip protein, partial [Gallionellaceae bacterium]
MELVNRHNLGFLFNPGGGQFLNDEKRINIQISAYDDKEDYEQLLGGLQKLGLEPANTNSIGGSAQLVVIRNPFDRRIRDERLLPLDSASVADILAANLPVSAEVSVAIDGELITREEWSARTLKPGEQLVVMPVLHDGDTLAVVAMVAVAVFAPYAAAALNTSMGLGLAAGSVGMGLLTAGIGMVGSMIVGGLMAPQKPSLPSRAGLQSYDNSPAYSWSPATTQQPGGVVNRAYGRHKLYGNIIAGYISNSGQEQTAHLLIDLGTGPYNLLHDFKINDQPVGNYTGVTVTTRMGNVNQDIIPAFNDTRGAHSIAAKVVLGTPITRDTIGSDYDALEILLLCPNGLWYSNDAGGLDNVSVNIKVEISDDGGATWNTVSVTRNTVAQVTPGYWSKGYWVVSTSPYSTTTFTQWHEVGQGSSGIADHVEGANVTPLTWPRQKWRWMDTVTDYITSVHEYLTLSGATQQPVRRQLRIDNLVRGTRYKVRVTNLSTDQTTSRYGDDVYLAELNEVMYDDFQYPRTVLVCVDALATNQLSGSLKFSCLAEAAIVRVWNGAAWSSVWSNNPAWVCWDILTQPVLDNSLAVVRYDGLDPARLDLAAFYTWAQFCDVSVPNGKGGTEKRCEWDGVFDTPTSTWDAALEVCSTARAQLVIRGTTITVVVDDTRSTPAQLFTVGNTAVSSFTETFLPMQDRAASIEVNYTNAEQDYTRDTLTVVNTAISDSTAQRRPLGLRGVTRTSQAWREANFRLKCNELLKRSAGIGVDIDALACTVGDLIWVQNDVTRWGVGGRAAAGSTTTKLQLDQSVTLDSGITYEVRLRLADDTLVTRTITTAAGTVTAVDVSVAFPSAPALYDVYAIGETSKAAKEFIVLDIQRDGNQRARLALIEYNSSLYGLDSGIPALPTIDISGNIVTAGLPPPLTE